MAKDNIPHICPTFGLLHDPTGQVGKGKKATDVAKESLKLIVFIFTNSVMNTPWIPFKAGLQNWLKILVFPIKVVEQEPVLSKRVVGLVLVEGTGRGNSEI